MRDQLLKAQLRKVALAILCVVCNCGVFAQSVPLPNAFAHNDYSHKRPLHEAMENGYTNMEADVFLHGLIFCLAFLFGPRIVFGNGFEIKSSGPVTRNVTLRGLLVK